MTRKIILLLITILLQSCNFGASGTWQNDKIEQEKRDEIKLLNDKLFNAIMTNNVKEVKDLLADELLKQGGNDIDKMVTEIYTKFNSKSYRILDEYNVTNTSENIGNTLASGVTGDHDYQIHYLALNKEMYVSLLIPNGHDNEILFTVIYGKYGDQWKINILRAGSYSMLKKTAPDYYKMAQENYNKFYLIDAINYVSLAKQCLKPANDIFKYQNEDEINSFYDKLIKEANSKYTLPLTLENVPTKPKVYSIYPEVRIEGYIPSIDYVTTIHLEDTIALQTEKDKMKIEITRLFNGIDQNKKAIFFTAFNELPAGNKPRKYYRMFEKMRK